MLSSIRECIDQISKEDSTFDEFYQQYVMAQQDALLNRHIRSIASSATCIEQLQDIEQKINELQYEL